MLNNDDITLRMWLTLCAQQLPDHLCRGKQGSKGTKSQQAGGGGAGSAVGVVSRLTVPPPTGRHPALQPHLGAAANVHI